MNRIIKFRVWSKIKLCWIDKWESAITLNGKLIIQRPDRLFTAVDDDEYSVMQFTGLKDRNGKNIYEGDIIKCGYGTGKVVFKSGCFWCEWIDDKEAYMEWIHSRKGTYIRTGTDEFEIIGNIYENKELLTNK